jgi:carbon-monoxide dehydrogenase large subunit
METLKIVGRSIPRIDGVDKVTGLCVFGADLKLPGMLYGKVLRSPLPHAKVIHVDTSRAERLSGVKTVVTGKDLPITYGGAVRDQPYYCFEKVRYIGDPVAGVAAVDEETAEEALDLIRVEYEELPAVFDPIRAMAPDAIRIHERLGEYWHLPFVTLIPGSNVCNHFKLRKGDIEEGFREADLIEEDTYTTAMVQHCHLEPHASISQVDSTGAITLWTNTQHPYSCLRDLSKSLGMPMNKIRVIVTPLGGGFGGKAWLKVEPLTVVLAMKVKNYRPVKITLTREEEFYATSVVRHPSIITIKSGIKKDGTLTAQKVRIILDTGAYADLGPMVTMWAGLVFPGPYKVPYIWTDVFCVYTNNPIAGAFRGFGNSQTIWAIESHMDALAEKLGMDPSEFRLKNAVEEGSISATGQVLNGVGIKECIQKVTAATKWKEKEKKEGRGKGIALMHQPTATPSASSSFIKIKEDGTVEVLVSTVEMGQGSNTVLTQIVAEELGIRMEDVRIVRPDTDITPYDHGTSASRSTFSMGNALRAAAVDAKKQLFEIAADLLEANPLDLVASEGSIYVKGSPEQKIPIGQIPMGSSYLGKGKPIIGKGTFTVPDAARLDPETGQSENPSVFWMYAAHVAEVEVDRETGKVKVLRMTAAHDLGRAINPLACEQQIEGALGMGVGMALMEELKLENGRPLNPNFVDYKLPTSMDMPEMEPIIVETYHERGPYGAKGLGEPALSATAPAIANAIYDAVGVRIKNLPITPDKVLKALREKETKSFPK